MQFGLYAAIVAAIIHFSSAPAYQPIDPTAALVKISFSHTTAPREPCRRQTDEEIAALAPNMRRPMLCTRERIDLDIALTIDGETVYSASVPPSGLARDGEATVYEKFTVDAGQHAFGVTMRDGTSAAAVDYAATHTATLQPGQLLIIDFDRVSDGFSFR